MVNETLVHLMSGRLKQQAYINNPDARNFLAEVATIILHILLNDGKYNVQIDQCLDNFKHRIFDYSVKQISLSEDLNFFQNKNELSLVNIYLGMLDIHFSFDEIRELLLLFQGVNDVRNDYKIILESQVAKTEEEVHTEEIEPPVINKLTDETDIIQYFSRKVASGYYKNIYKLLVDFTLMVYRKGSTSVDLSFPSLSDIITYINKNIYTYWVHAKPAEELERTFTYMWKKAKPLHLNRAVLAFRLPYAINKEGDFIQVETKKNTLTTIAPPNTTEKKVTPQIYNLSEPHTDTILINEDPQNVAEKVIELFDNAEKYLLEEDKLLQCINYLIKNKAWINAYDLFGDVSYIIFYQTRIVRRKHISINYQTLKAFEDKQRVFDSSFKKLLVTDSRQELRNSLRSIWFSQYSILTLQKIGELFESIDKIGKHGEISLNPDCSDYQFYHFNNEQLPEQDLLAEPEQEENREVIKNPVNDSGIPSDVETGINEDAVDQSIEIVIPESDATNLTLDSLYDDADNYYLKEDKIINIHKDMALAHKWDNASHYVASISYVIIKQIAFANSGWGLHYSKLKNLYRKCIVIMSNFNITINDNQHYENVESIREKLIRQYGMNLLIDFYKSVIGMYEIDNDGVIITDDSDNNPSDGLPSDSSIEEKKIKEENLKDETTTDDDFEEVDVDDDDVIEIVKKDDEIEDEIEEQELEDDLDESPVTISFSSQNRAEKELADYWCSIFPQGYYNKCIWRNKISTETYESLYKYLKSCANENERGFTKRFAKAIVLYCAEWYKREYNGNDGKKNPLKSIGVNCPTADLWKWAEIDNKLLYKHEYLESIYVLGGFPITYLVNKKFDDFMPEISSAYKSNAEEDSISEKIFVNNGTVQESLRQHRGSLFQYKNLILSKQEYPFSETDLKKEPFQTFITGLKDYRREHEKFLLEWIVEYNENTPYFRRRIKIHLNSEENGIHNKRIPYYRIKTNIKNKKDFNLYLRFNDEDIEEVEERQHIRFVNTYNGYFIGEMTENYYTFSDIPTMPIEKISIVIKNDISDKFEELQEEIIPSYLQLYKTGEYSTYVSKPNKGESYILLPFSYQILSVYNHENESPKYLAEHGTMYRFAQIVEVFSFKDDNGQEFTLYPHNNKIEMLPVVYNDTFIYNENFYMKRITIDDEGVESESKVFLIFKRSDIRCTRFYDDADPEIFDDEDITIEFKSENDRPYTKWTNEVQPEKGFLRLRVSVQNRQRNFNVYYIPSQSNPFVRNCPKGTIELEDSISPIWCSTGIIHNNIISIPSDYKDASGCHKRFVELRIGEENDYVEMRIISPLNIIELHKDGACIKQYSNNKNANIKIPVLYKDAFSFYKFDEHGFTTFDLKNEDVNITDLRLEDDILSLDKTVTRETPVGDIEFYLCHNKKSAVIQNNIKFIIGEAGSDNYIFYYWDMTRENSPIRIEYDYTEGINIDDYKNGIIFQSLEGDAKPRHYLAPILTTYNQKWPDDCDNEIICVKCFEIAMSHNVPFRVFKPLYRLLEDTDSRLVLFFSIIMLLHWEEQDTTKIYSELIRLSNELYFAWPFLNIKVWKQCKKEYDRIINILGYTSIYGLSKDEFEDKLIEKAKMLFMKYGNALNQANPYALIEFTNIYWNKYDDGTPRLASINDIEKWYAVDQKTRYDRWRPLYSRALCFMRARLNVVKVRRNDGADGYKTLYPEIIGFTNKENKDDVRNIEKICRFLQLLYKDDDSFGKIVRFFKRNQIIS